jgi:hypothetical protein
LHAPVGFAHGEYAGIDVFLAASGDSQQDEE